MADFAICSGFVICCLGFCVSLYLCNGILYQYYSINWLGWTFFAVELKVNLQLDRNANLIDSETVKWALLFKRLY